MKASLLLTTLPLAVRLLIVASVGGLLLGLLLGLASGKSRFAGGIDDWGELAPLDDIPVDILSQQLRQSGLWSAEGDDAADTELVPGRPGAFKHLKLIAIIEDGSRSAVMRIVGDGEELAANGGILLPVAGGLVQVREGESLLAGWILAELGATRLRFESAESGTVEYDLFGEF